MPYLNVQITFKYTRKHTHIQVYTLYTLTLPGCLVVWCLVSWQLRNTQISTDGSLTADVKANIHISYWEKQNCTVAIFFFKKRHTHQHGCTHIDLGNQLICLSALCPSLCFYLLYQSSFSHSQNPLSALKTRNLSSVLPKSHNNGGLWTLRVRAPDTDKPSVERPNTKANPCLPVHYGTVIRTQWRSTFIAFLMLIRPLLLIPFIEKISFV